jgi:hypothetical protein
MRRLMICTSYPKFFGDNIEKNELGTACNAYGGEESHIQGFDCET